MIRRGLATLFAVSLNVQTGACDISVFTAQACVCCNRGRTSPIYLHVVMFSSLLFVPALFNVALVPPPVLADPTGSRVCRRATLAAPSLRGWIRCVCRGERWLGVGSTEAGRSAGASCQLSQREFDAPLFSRSTSPRISHRDLLFIMPRTTYSFFCHFEIL